MSMQQTCCRAQIQDWARDGMRSYPVALAMPWSATMLHSKKLKPQRSSSFAGNFVEVQARRGSEVKGWCRMDSKAAQSLQPQLKYPQRGFYGSH